MFFDELLKQATLFFRENETVKDGDDNEVVTITRAAIEIAHDFVDTPKKAAVMMAEILDRWPDDSELTEHADLGGAWSPKSAVIAFTAHALIRELKANPELTELDRERIELEDQLDYSELETKFQSGIA